MSTPTMSANPSIMSICFPSTVCALSIYFFLQFKWGPTNLYWKIINSILVMPLGNYCFENLVFKYSSSMCVKWWRISYVVSVLRSAGLLKCFNVGDCTTCNSCILHFLPETKTQLDRVGFDLHCLSIIENFAINDNKNNIIDNNIIPSNKNSNENNNNDNNKMRITCL